MVKVKPEGHGMRKTQLVIAGFLSGREPQTKECGSLEKLKKARKWIFSRISRQEHSPADILMRPFQSSDL